MVHIVRRTGGLTAIVALAVTFSVALSGQAKAATDYRYDRSFGSNGLVKAITGSADLSAELPSKVLLKDKRGRIVLGAANGKQWQIRRYYPNGRLDAGFGDGGLVAFTGWGGIGADTEGIRATLTSGVIRPNGRILLAGFVKDEAKRGLIDPYIVLKQLLPDGTPDASFGQSEGGETGDSTNGAVGVDLLPSGKFLTAGFSDLGAEGVREVGILKRYKPDGDDDRTFFGSIGLEIPATRADRSLLLDVEVLPSGKILVAGTSKSRYLVIKLKKNGKYVRSFGKKGRAIFDPGGKGCRCSIGRAMDRDRKGRIVVTGQVRPDDPEKAGYGVTVRFRRGGKLDRSFGKNGVAKLRATKPDGRRTTVLYDTAIDRYRGIWVTGSAGDEFARTPRWGVTVRYLPNGRRDRRFFKGGLLRGRTDSPNYGGVLKRDGRRMYLGGRFDRGDQEGVFMRRFRPR
jgi:uncharacterized delta-60 repeat protein